MCLGVVWGGHVQRAHSFVLRINQTNIMRRFYNHTAILALSDEQRAHVFQGAEAGEPVACFQQAQIYRYLHTCKDYVSSAYKLLVKASEAGVADADAAIAVMMFKGEIEPYDPVAAARLLEKALNNKSELAATFHLMNIIYGRYGCKQNTELAMNILDSLIAENDNPEWYALKGELLSQTNRNKEAVVWFEKAIEAGYVDAYDGLAFAKSMDDQSGAQDMEIFADVVKEGGDAGNSMCMYYLSLIKMIDFEYAEFDSDKERDEVRNIILRGFEQCAEDSLSIAFDTLGDIYLEGKMELPVDIIKAWNYYLRGSEYMNPHCFERMYTLLSDDEIELKGIGRDEAIDLCLINGARLRSKLLILEAVDAYKHGRLTKFAREMEMFHIPAADAISEVEPPYDEDDEDEVDDDGRYDAWA